MVAQVTRPPEHSGGNPSASQTQRRTTSSNSAAIGDITRNAAFWFHAPASQLAASAAGTIPPFGSSLLLRMHLNAVKDTYARAAFSSPAKIPYSVFGGVKEPNCLLIS